MEFRLLPFWPAKPSPNKDLSPPIRMVLRVHSSLAKPAAEGPNGGNLTVISSTECAVPRTKIGATAILPLLVILFVVSYCILTLLVFEQGQTIESQRTLIREMLKDSTQLASMKGKQARDDCRRVQDKSSVQTEQKSAVTNSPGAVKGSDKETKRPTKSGRAMKVTPGKPAADLEDVRRSTRVI
jgi:hypothetical protein